MEQRAQKKACLHYAESRQRKTKGQNNESEENLKNLENFENIVKKTSKAYEYKKLNNIYNKVYAIPSFSIILCADKLFSEKFTNVYRLNNFDTLIL